jgi:hypothetical protein
MPNGGGPNPRFTIRAHFNRQLDLLGLWPWTYSADIGLCVVPAGWPQGQASPLLPMRLDSATFVSAIPEEWMRFLGHLLVLGPGAVQFGTIAGAGTGQMGSAASLLQGPNGQEHLCQWDYLVTPGLNGRGYGLISLWDVMNHFTLRSEGPVQLGPGGRPITLPTLELSPRGLQGQAGYTCPVCSFTVRGQPGLQLTCDGCKVSLGVNVP